MSKETKFIQVRSSEVSDTIEKMGWFGWELLGAPQQGLNGFSVTFQRDKSLSCYKELCELENKYDTAKFEMDKYNRDLMGLSGFSVSDRDYTISLRNHYSQEVIDCMKRAQSIQTNGVGSEKAKSIQTNGVESEEAKNKIRFASYKPKKRS